jgi:ankyrin repeat protein
VKLIIKTMEDKFGHEGVLDILAQEDDDMNTPLFICVESGSYESAKVQRNLRMNIPNDANCSEPA